MTPEMLVAELERARGPIRSGLRQPPSRCRLTPIRVTAASLPLFAETGSQIQSAGMATKEK
jgi:hypothetical protein